MQASIAIWDKHSSPLVEQRVDFWVRVHEHILIEEAFLRVAFGAAQMSSGSLKAVIEHAVKSIAST